MELLLGYMLGDKKVPYHQVLLYFLQSGCQVLSCKNRTCLQLTKLNSFAIFYTLLPELVAVSILTHSKSISEKFD